MNRYFFSEGYRKRRVYPPTFLEDLRKQCKRGDTLHMNILAYNAFINLPDLTGYKPCIDREKLNRGVYGKFFDFTIIVGPRDQMVLRGKRIPSLSSRDDGFITIVDSRGKNIRASMLIPGMEEPHDTI